MAKIMPLEHYDKAQLVTLIKSQTACIISVSEQLRKLEAEESRLVAAIDVLKETLFTRYPDELIAGEFKDL